MKTTIRFGIAAAAALALTPSVRATDEQPSEMKDDVERAEESPATARQARAALPRHRSDAKAEAAAKPAEDLGSGSGGPARPTEAELKQAEELQRIWTGP